MQKTKVAVIGSGVGAITAVYALTQTKDWSAKYDITIYQMGWRSGGKGASGRNAQFGQRIEEHGLHVWAGFYDNAFRNIRQCYKQLNDIGLRHPDDPLGTFEKAFKPLAHLFLAERVPTDNPNENQWRPWSIELPTNDKALGSEQAVPGPFSMLHRILEIMVYFIAKGELAPDGNKLGFVFPSDLHDAFKAIHQHTSSMPSEGHRHHPNDRNILASLISSAQMVTHRLETPENIKNDPVRRGLYLADLGLAYMHGLVNSDCFVRGYDVLDQWEFSDWLAQNGASKNALEWVSVRGCYDFVFGFSAGDTRKGDVGAGTAIRAMTRLLFTYSSAIFQKMQAGMGDTIFAPYFQVLNALGVKFEYFCAARELHLDNAGIEVDRISMVRQAEVKSAPYQPLVDVQGLPCWPSEPDWSQLVDGEKLRKSGVDFECEKSPPSGTPFTLEKGRDFDIVILGASIGSLHYMTKELAKASDKWSNMLQNVKTVGTHAAQLWLAKTVDDLGWRAEVEAHNNAHDIPQSPMQTIITGFDEPLDTWADMSHLLPIEDWTGDGPKSLSYFCAPAPDGETLKSFETNLKIWQDKDLVHLWPNAAKDGKFDTSLYYENERSAVYSRVNMYGSERYVLSTTGSIFHRLAPDESGFANLFLAGDWTRCGINAGCVEAATISGIAAAAAISGEKLLNVGAKDVEDTQTVADMAMYCTNSVTGADWPLTPFYARGEMTGWYVFYELPKVDVAKMLPDGIYLGHSPMARPGFHPVGISFCKYQNVRGSFLPKLFAMLPYGEATFAIPYTVNEEGGLAPYLYPRRLYVDNKTAIFAGKFFYAMNKEPAEIDVDNSRFSATNGAGLRIDARFQQHTSPIAASRHPAHSQIADLIGTSFVTRKRNGRLLYNAFNLELDHAYIAPVSGQVSIHDPDIQGFDNINQDFAPLGVTKSNRLPGAFRIWCSWSMTNPLDSTRIRHATTARHWINTKEK